MGFKRAASTWVAVLVAGAGSLGLAACGNSSSPQGSSTPGSTPAATTTTSAPLALGVEAPRRDIPWKQVGQGWTLALWGSSATPPDPEQPPTTAPGATESLYLLNPLGGRYLVTTLPFDNALMLGSWSGDGKRAIVVGQGGSGGTGVTEVDLVSGATHTIDFPHSMTVTYTNPDGLALLGASEIDPELQRLSLTGAVELTYPAQFGALGAFNGASRESPDGTEVAMGTHGGGIALVDNAGKILSELTIPGTSYCSPLRWWAAAEVLTSCLQGPDDVMTLWLVPTSGSAPSALTVPPPAGSQDVGDEDAWKVGAGTYLQDAGACGYVYLAVLNPDHTTSPVAVPGVAQGDSQIILGADGAQLLVQSSVSCGAGISLLWFNPQSTAVKVVLGPGANGGNVRSALLFGDDN